MTTKYLSKKMVKVNDNLRIYEYFYATHITLYITPKSKDEPVKVVRIDLANLKEEEAQKIAEMNGIPF